MANTIRALIILCALSSFSKANAAQPKDPFAGRRASCISDEPVMKEEWRFIGMAKEYAKKMKIAGQVIEQKGKYSVKGSKLSIEEFKDGTKTVDPERKFALKFELNEDGFEYLWSAVAGKERNYTCTWIR